MAETETKKKTVKKAPKTEKPVKEEKATAKKAEAKKVEEKKVEKPVVTEAHAFSRDIRITPRKVRLVADLVRGKKVSDALGILTKTPRVGATPIYKIIHSAAANAVNNFGMNKDNLYVAEIQVSDGMKIKRFIPRAKGSASPIIKRLANVAVTIKERK